MAAQVKYTDRKCWTQDEVAILNRAIAKGKTIPQMVRLLPGRSAKAIDNRISRMGMKQAPQKAEAPMGMFASERRMRDNIIAGTQMLAARLQALGMIHL